MARNKNHHLVKRGNVWYFRKKVKGKEIKRRLSKSIVEARRIRDEYLKEIMLYGDIQLKEEKNGSILFGEVAQEWVKVKAKELKGETLRDYRSAMNHHILPRFGNMPIAKIKVLHIRSFIAELECSAKRINNILVPLRSVFKFAFESEIIETNPMNKVSNLKTTKPEIYPLSMEEVALFLKNVHPRYRNFFIVAFFTGMRFGEMAALKWEDIDFRHRVIKVRRTRIKGVEDRPKTRSSIRDVFMLDPVKEALLDQRKATMGKYEHVFVNQYGRPLLPDSVNECIWKPALRKAGLKGRPLYQTRHTFATLMLDAGEVPGWVQKMMGHSSLQMIHETYYSYIKNYRRDEGISFIENVYKPIMSDTAKAKKVYQKCTKR